MKRAWILFALAACIWAASTEKPRFRRAALTAMEVSFDQRLKTLSDDPYLLVGLTRGVYLEGYSRSRSLLRANEQRWLMDAGRVTLHPKRAIISGARLGFDVNRRDHRHRGVPLVSYP